MKHYLLVVLLGLTIFGAAAFNKYDLKPKEQAPQQSLCGPPLVLTTGLEDYLHPKEEPNYFVHISSWAEPITKNQLLSAESIEDILSPSYKEHIVEYHSVTVEVVKDGEHSEIQAASNGALLTPSQLALFEKANLYSKYVFEIDCVERNPETGQTFEHQINPHYGIAPAKQASYRLGDVELKDYLMMNSKAAYRNVEQNKLGSARIYFTVSETGDILQMQRDRSCGYSEVDKKMEELLKSLPANWNPAKNENDQNVSQELVLSYGMGC